MKPAELESVVGRRLAGLPAPEAPPSLLPRVMEAVRRDQHKRWYARSWETWPMGLRGGFRHGLRRLRLAGKHVSGTRSSRRGPGLDPDRPFLVAGLLGAERGFLHRVCWCHGRNPASYSARHSRAFCGKGIPNEQHPHPFAGNRLGHARPRHRDSGSGAGLQFRRNRNLQRGPSEAKWFGSARTSR